MEASSNLNQITVRLFLATLIVFLLIVGKPFLIPFAWSLLIALASVRFIEYFERKTMMSKGMVIFIFLLLVLSVIFAIGYFFYIELSLIFSDLPYISQRISAILHDLSVSLQGIGIHIPDHIDKNYISNWVHEHNNIIVNFISEIGMNLWTIILILFYLFFLLYYRDLVPRFFIHKISNREALEKMNNRFHRSMTLIRSYIYGLLLLTLVSAVLNYLVFLIFGLQYGLFFAIFLAILNLIPFIGNPIGLVVIMLFAFITKDNALIPLLIFASLFFMNFLQDNVVRPLLIGDKMKINAFAVFVAIIMGGMIWGVSGMILFIPVVGIIKIVLEEQRTSKAYAIFFSEPGKHKLTGKSIYA